MAGRSRVRVALVATFAVFGVVAILFAAWMFSSIRQGGTMAGYARDLGVIASIAGLLAFGVAIVGWRMRGRR
jgi:hypothetical protein